MSLSEKSIKITACYYSEERLNTDHFCLDTRRAARLAVKKSLAGERIRTQKRQRVIKVKCLRGSRTTRREHREAGNCRDAERPRLPPVEARRPIKDKERDGDEHGKVASRQRRQSDNGGQVTEQKVAASTDAAEADHSEEGLFLEAPVSSTRKPPSKRGGAAEAVGGVSPRALSDGVSSHGIRNERLSAAAGGFKAGPEDERPELRV